MKNSENVILTINIGGEQLSLSIPADRVAAVKNAESAVRQLYADRRQKLPKYSDREILAMVTYIFASSYQELLEKYNRATALAEKCENQLDRWQKLISADTVEKEITLN